VAASGIGAASGTGATSHPFLVADPGAHSPVVCPVFTLDGRTVRTISAVMTFETAVEVTPSQLRIAADVPYRLVSPLAGEDDASHRPKRRNHPPEDHST